MGRVSHGLQDPRGGVLGERVLLTHCPRVGPWHGGLTGQPTAPEDHVVQGHSAPVCGISGGKEGHLKKVGSLGPRSGLRPPSCPHPPDRPCPPPHSPGSHPGFGQWPPPAPASLGPRALSFATGSASRHRGSAPAAAQLHLLWGPWGSSSPCCLPQPAGCELPWDPSPSSGVPPSLCCSPLASPVPPLRAPPTPPGAQGPGHAPPEAA